MQSSTAVFGGVPSGSPSVRRTARSGQRALRFDHILEQDGDALVRPTRSPRESLDGAFEIVFRPFETFSAQADVVSIRDLLEPEKVVVDPVVQDLVDEERLRLLGADLGWETDKILRTRMNFEPRFGDLIRTDLGWQTFYSSRRTATFVDRSLDPVGDTAVALVRNVNGGRDFTGSVHVDSGCGLWDARRTLGGIATQQGGGSDHGCGRPYYSHLSSWADLELRSRSGGSTVFLPLRFCWSGRVCGVGG